MLKKVIFNNKKYQYNIYTNNKFDLKLRETIQILVLNFVKVFILNYF